MASKSLENSRTVSLAGNPNVGKSTLFNALTGLKQHTGNWTGKTVASAKGYFKFRENNYILVDIPGTYSLFAHSEEEEIARDFIIFGSSYKTVIVCDATALERNLNLVLQTLEIKDNVIVCVNLIDEAEKKGIKIDFKKLSTLLRVPVIPTIARKKKTLHKLLLNIDTAKSQKPLKVRYCDILENAISLLEPNVKKITNNRLPSRWVSVCLLNNDKNIIEKINLELNTDIESELEEEIKKAKNYLESKGLKEERISDLIANTIVTKAEEISNLVVTQTPTFYTDLQRKADRIITDKKFSFILFALLLAIIFWITVKGANYLSGYLTIAFSKLEEYIVNFLELLNASDTIKNIITEGLLRVPFWVVSVMLPPMAIFFPLFTLLEDSGFLPRIAFCLDKPFKKCHSCGKQSLTMCMGFGCNAVGVVGARIIDSKREKLLAIITNALVPCNGRFPTLITLISIFMVSIGGIAGELLSSLFLTLFILLSVFMTLILTKFLSHTFLKGEESSYTLELPPYRKPQILKVLTRSVFDRTLFVLGRALSVAIPCGIIIFLLGNIEINGQNLLLICSDFLDPIGRAIGLDGVILLGFILGFPANEIVLPIILMCYLSGNTLVDISNISAIKDILIANGWTLNTALCMTVFCLFHFPCSTTILSIKKETGSIKWTFLSMILPTLIGIILCILITTVSKLF